MRAIIHGKQVLENTLVKTFNGITQSNQYLVASSDSNVKLTIDSNSATHSLILNWHGNLPIDRGGLNNSTFTEDRILIANSDKTAIVSSDYKFNDAGESSTDIWSAGKVKQQLTIFQTRKVEFMIGDGEKTSFVLDHNLGTKFVIVQIFESESGEAVEAAVSRPDENNVVVSFSKPPLEDQYSVVII